MKVSPVQSWRKKVANDGQSQCHESMSVDVCDNLPNVPSIQTKTNLLDISNPRKQEVPVIAANMQVTQTCEENNPKPLTILKTGKSFYKSNKPAKTTSHLSHTDRSKRETNTGSYVHSVSKFVYKQRQKYNEQSSESEIKNIPSVDMKDFSQSLESKDSSSVADSSVSVLESLRLRLFASAGVRPVEVVDKPKVFESKIKQPKVKHSPDLDKNSSQESKSQCNSDNLMKSVNKPVIDNESSKSNNFSSRSSNLSGHSTPRSSTPNSEILDEVSKKLECLQKAKRKHNRPLVQRPKRPRFEQKKFMLRSMVPKQAESDSESHSSVATVNSGDSARDSVKQKKETKCTPQSDNKKTSKQVSPSAREKAEVDSKTNSKGVKNVRDGKIPKQIEKKQLVKPKPAKCHACGHVFKNKDLLKKHYPCRMRQTRTWSQNKLRPNRVFRYVEAPPKEQGRKRFICLLPKSKKQDPDKSRPQLLAVRKTKFKRVKGKRRRKLYMILQELAEKRKPRTYPHLCVNYENLTTKSQFFYKLGLFSPSLDQHSSAFDYYHPKVETYLQGRDEHDKENRFECLESETMVGLESTHRGMQYLPVGYEKQVYDHFQKSQSIYTIPIEQLAAKDVSDGGQKHFIESLDVYSAKKSNNKRASQLSDGTETPPVLDKYEQPGEYIELYDTDVVIDRDSNEPPVLELQFESPKKMQKERHFLDFAENTTEKSADSAGFDSSNLDTEEMDGSQSSNDLSNDEFKISVKNITKLKNISNSLHNSPAKLTTQRHFTDIIDVAEIRSPKMEERSIVNDNVLWEQSERGEMTLAEIREMLKPNSRKENEFSKESLLKLRFDLANLLATVRTPVKNDVRPLVQAEPSLDKKEIETLDIDFSAYERKSLFESLENVEASNFDREISFDETGRSSSESDSSSGSEQSDPYKSSLDYEQDLLPPTYGEGDSLESTTKGCITDNILQMLSTLEDKGSVAENMSNLLQILAENLGIIDSSKQEQSLEEGIENKRKKPLEKTSSLSGDEELVSDNNKTVASTYEKEEQLIEAATFSENYNNILLLEKMSETNTESSQSSVNLHKESSANVRNTNNLTELSDSRTALDLKSGSELFPAYSMPHVELPTGSVNTMISLRRSSDIIVSNNAGELDSEPSGQSVIDKQQHKKDECKEKIKKESVLFKSITELNSIETDSDSNLGDSYDAETMSRRLAELKATNYDASASDVNSDVLSDYKENDNESDSETISSDKSKDITTEKLKSLYSYKDKEEILITERPVVSQSPTALAYDSDIAGSGEESNRFAEERPRLIMKIKIPAGASFDTSDDSSHKDSSSCTSASLKSSDVSDVEEIGRSEDDTLVEAEAEFQDEANYTLVQQEDKDTISCIKSNEVDVELNKTVVLKEDRGVIPYTNSDEVEDEINQMITDTQDDSNANVDVDQKVEINTEPICEVTEILSLPRKLKLNTDLTIGDSFDYESDTGSSSFEREVTIIPRVGTSPRAADDNSISIKFDFKTIDDASLSENESVNEAKQFHKVNEGNKNICSLAVSDEKGQDSSITLTSAVSVTTNDIETERGLINTSVNENMLSLSPDNNDSKMSEQRDYVAPVEETKNKNKERKEYIDALSSTGKEMLNYQNLADTEEKLQDFQKLNEDIEKNIEGSNVLALTADQSDSTNKVNNEGETPENITFPNAVNVELCTYAGSQTNATDTEEREHSVINEFKHNIANTDNASHACTVKGSEGLQETVLGIETPDDVNEFLVTENVGESIDSVGEIPVEKAVIELQMLAQINENHSENYEQAPEENTNAPETEKKQTLASLEHSLMIDSEPKKELLKSGDEENVDVENVNNRLDINVKINDEISGSCELKSSQISRVDLDGVEYSTEMSVGKSLYGLGNDFDITNDISADRLSSSNSEYQVNSTTTSTQSTNTLRANNVNHPIPESTFHTADIQTGTSDTKHNITNDSLLTKNLETGMSLQGINDKNVDKMKRDSKLKELIDVKSNKTSSRSVEENVKNNKSDCKISSAVSRLQIDRLNTAERSIQGTETRMYTEKVEENKKNIGKNVEEVIVETTLLNKADSDEKGTKVQTVSDAALVLKSDSENKEVNEQSNSQVMSILKGSNINDESAKNLQSKKRRISYTDYLSRVKRSSDSKKREDDHAAKAPIRSKIANKSYENISENSSKSAPDIVIDENMYDLNQASQNWHNPSVYSKKIQNEIFSAGNRLTKVDSGLSENVVKTKVETMVEPFIEPQTFDKVAIQKDQKSKRFVSMPLTKKSDILSIENKTFTRVTPEKSFDSTKSGSQETKSNKESEVTKSEDDVLDVFDSLFSLGETVLSLNKPEQKSDLDKSQKEDDGNLFSALDTLCKVGEGILSSRKSTEEPEVKEPVPKQVVTEVIEDVTEVIDLTETLDESLMEEREGSYRAFFLDINEWLTHSDDTENVKVGESLNKSETKKEEQRRTVYTNPGDYLSVMSGFSGVHLNRFRYNIFAFEEEFFEIRLKEDENDRNTEVDSSAAKDLGTCIIVDNLSSDQHETVACDNTVVYDNTEPSETLQTEQENYVEQENNDVTDSYNEGYDDDDFADMLAAQMALNEEAMSQNVATVSEEKASLECEDNENIEKSSPQESLSKKVYTQQHSLVSMEYDTISEESLSDEDSQTGKPLNRKFNENKLQNSDSRSVENGNKLPETGKANSDVSGKELKQQKSRSQTTENGDTVKRSSEKSQPSNKEQSVDSAAVEASSDKDESSKKNSKLMPS